jgi:hypothetical protein
LWTKELTIAHNKQIDAQKGKSLSNFVVSVLEFTLHDGRVDFGDDHTAEPYKEKTCAMLAHAYLIHWIGWSHVLRPSLSGRKLMAMAFEMKAQVPQTAANARIVVGDIPKDL